jgi:NitT/TauT family transport system ATP-binding protein
LDSVSFDIAPSEFVSLLGPSGCGKTTLLRIINGLILPDGGTVMLDGEPPVPGRNMATVFQQSRLLPWLTVLNNVMFPLSVVGTPKREANERAMALLDLVGLNGFAERFPHQLSGGMQQRAGLARALIQEPEVLLMDEPFAALDAMTREFLQEELLRIWARRKSAVVFVTHNIDEAIMLSQRIIVMSPRPGRVADIIDVPLSESDRNADMRFLPVFQSIRQRVWQQIRGMVADTGAEPAGSRS